MKLFLDSWDLSPVPPEEAEEAAWEVPPEEAEEAALEPPEVEASRLEAAQGEASEAADDNN